MVEYYTRRRSVPQISRFEAATVYARRQPVAIPALRLRLRRRRQCLEGHRLRRAGELPTLPSEVAASCASLPRCAFAAFLSRCVTITRTCSGLCKKTYLPMSAEKVHELTKLPTTGSC